MKLSVVVLLLVQGLASCGAAKHEPVIGGPCEGCGDVFVEIPARLHSTARIAPADEKGEPLVLEGTVRNAKGSKAGGVIVYAYHTDAGGIYPEGRTRHGRLRGWARTDAEGNYRFETMRPGAYPSRNNPQHIHMHLIESGKGTYYIDDVTFEDDSLLTPEHRNMRRPPRGGSGLCRPEKDEQGVWHARRDIVLGQNIPEYP